MNQLSVACAIPMLWWEAGLAGSKGRWAPGVLSSNRDLQLLAWALSTGLDPFTQSSVGLLLLRSCRAGYMTPHNAMITEKFLCTWPLGPKFAQPLRQTCTGSNSLISTKTTITICLNTGTSCKMAKLSFGNQLL